MFNALSLDTRKHTDEYSIRFGSVRFGTKVNYHQDYDEKSQIGLTLDGAVKLLSEDIALVKALKPYSKHLIVEKEIREQKEGDKITLFNRITSTHPRLKNTKREFNISDVEFISATKVRELNDSIIQRVAELHDILVQAGLAKPIKIAAKTKVADE